MISSTHITTGAALGLAVGSFIPNPIIACIVAFGVGVVSHHILDTIPHTDPGSFRKEGDTGPIKPHEKMFAYPDNIISTVVVLVIFFTRHPSWPMLFGAAGGNMPDVWHNADAWADYTRHKIFPGYFKFHEDNHWTARGPLIPLGIITNAGLIVASLWYLLSR